MNDDEIKCLCKKLSESNRKITTLECKNYGLEKENERLRERIDLLENRPVPRHYEDSPNLFYRIPLDSYTLEKVYWIIKFHNDKLSMQCINNVAQLEASREIEYIVWDLLDKDSQDWIIQNRDKYYGDGNDG